jgi:hypothetical protein
MNKMMAAFAAAVLCTAPAVALDSPFDVPLAAPATCGHGTKLEFVGSPKEAAAQAKKEQKLVLVLHVSGYFEDPSLT